MYLEMIQHFHFSSITQKVAESCTGPPTTLRSACRRLGACDRRPHRLHHWRRSRGGLCCFARLLWERQLENFHGFGEKSALKIPIYFLGGDWNAENGWKWRISFLLAKNQEVKTPRKLWKHYGNSAIIGDTFCDFEPLETQTLFLILRLKKPSYFHGVIYILYISPTNSKNLRFTVVNHQDSLRIPNQQRIVQVIILRSLL